MAIGAKPQIDSRAPRKLLHGDRLTRRRRRYRRELLKSQPQAGSKRVHKRMRKRPDRLWRDPLWRRARRRRKNGNKCRHNREAAS